MHKNDDILDKYFKDLKNAPVPESMGLGVLLNQADKGLIKSTVKAAFKFKKWMWIMNTTAVIMVSSGIFLASMSPSETGQKKHYDPEQNSIATDQIDTNRSDTTRIQFVESESELPSISEAPDIPQTQETLADYDETPTPEPLDLAWINPRLPHVVGGIVSPPAISVLVPPLPEPTPLPNREITIKTDCEVDGKTVQKVKGNGKVTKENRDVGNFNILQQNSVIDVHYEQSETYSVVVQAEENVMPYVSTDVHGKTLEIKICGVKNLEPTEDIIVWIKGPDLNGIQSYGTGNIMIDSDLETENINLTNSGTGDVVFANSLKAKELKIFAFGTGDVIFKDQISLENVSIENDGTGDVMIENLSAREYKVKMGGVGDVIFKSASSSESGKIVNDGSGSFKAKQHKTDHVKVELHGVGNVHIDPVKTLKIKMSGTGNVIATQKPPEFSLDKNGIGKFKVK